jgi:hypothetical protein
LFTTFLDAANGYTDLSDLSGVECFLNIGAFLFINCSGEIETFYRNTEPIFIAIETKKQPSCFIAKLGVSGSY